MQGASSRYGMIYFLRMKQQVLLNWGCISFWWDILYIIIRIYKGSQSLILSFNKTVGSGALEELRFLMNATEMDAKLTMSCEKQRLLGRRKTATLKPLLEQVFCLHNVSGACRREEKLCLCCCLFGRAGSRKIGQRDAVNVIPRSPPF